MSPIQQGLYVSLIGIVILFVAAAIFYLLIVGMNKLFPVKTAADEIPEEAAVATAAPAQAEDKAVIAVIIAALQNTQGQSIPGLGDSLLENRGSWWSARVNSAHKSARISRK